MASTPNNNKRQREDEPIIDDVLVHARRIWQRDPYKQRAVSSEDDDFRSFFGCGPIVFLSLWNLLAISNAVPDGGTIEHLLWTLMFLKLYSGQKALCALAGGVDPETFRTWVWKFVLAVAELESEVVSNIHATDTSFNVYYVSRTISLLDCL